MKKTAGLILSFFCVTALFSGNGISEGFFFLSVYDNIF